MSEQLLVVLRVCLLSLVYLTFFRVLRAVWVELRTESRVVVAPPVVVAASGSERATPSARSGSSNDVMSIRLVVLAPASLAGTVFDLHGETTVGRAPGCGVVIDDQRVSKLHARLYPSGGRWAVEDLGSTNGTLLNDGVVDRPRTAGPGDRVQVGEHVLELL